MAKKGKDEVPNPNSVANRDIIQRLNFLYQASQVLGSMGLAEDKQPAVQRSVLKGKARKTERKAQIKRRHPTTLADLSRTYVTSMKTIGQKTNVRIDPSVKRTLCKGCNLVLVPGVTVLVRVHASSSHGHVVSYSCIACKTCRRIPAPPVPGPEVETSRAAPCTFPSTRIADPRVVHDGQDPEAMTIDVLSEPQQQQQRRGRRKKKVLIPRTPPFFERNVGHVIFRGNERLE